MCTDAGYELVDVEIKNGPNGIEFRVFADYPEGTVCVDSKDTPKAFGFDECTNLSREISAYLDVEDVFSVAYHLEVSSPGLERPLRTPAHFRRFAPSEIKLKLHHPLQNSSFADTLQGRKKLKGLLLSIAEDDSHITVEIDGSHSNLPFADIRSAHLVPNWNALMKGSGTKAK